MKTNLRKLSLSQSSQIFKKETPWDEAIKRADSGIKDGHIRKNN